MKFEFSELPVPEIKNVFDNAEDFERLKRTVAAKLFSQRAEVFDQQGGASGQWQALARSTLARRNKLIKTSKKRASDLRDKGMGGVKILQDTGTLRQSFTPEAGPGNADRIEEINGDQVRIATNVEYAAIHNFGGVINFPGTKNGFGRGIEIPAHAITIPARPFDEFSDQNLDEINELTELFVDGQL